MSIGPTFIPNGPIAFGNVPVGGVATRQIGLTNDTSTAIDPGLTFTISSVSVSGVGFTLAEDSCRAAVLEVDTSCVVRVGFQPDERGTHDGVLSVVTVPSGIPATQWQLRGIGGFGLDVGPAPTDPTATQAPEETETDSVAPSPSASEASPAP